VGTSRAARAPASFALFPWRDEVSGRMAARQHHRLELARALILTSLAAGCADLDRSEEVALQPRR
jgi:hypothetical protein